MTVLDAALSDYGQRLVEERQRLLSQLVGRLSGAKHTSERHAKLLAESLAEVQHPRYADTNPRSVDEQLARLGERFAEHAQYPKQRALQLLRKELLAAQLESSQYDFPHRLLAFLYSAARSPLSTQYSGSAGLLAELEAAAQAAVLGPPPPPLLLSQLSAGSGGSDSWQEEFGACSPGSQLSEWSDLGAEVEAGCGTGSGLELAWKPTAGAAAGQQALTLPAAGTSPSEQRLAADAPSLSGGWANPATPRCGDTLASPAASPARLAPPPRGPPREAPYGHASLSVWLASKRSGGQPERLLDPRLCFQERELLQQVLHMLKGVAAPGPAFQLDIARSAYTTTPGVHMHSSSHGSVQTLLCRFARAGTCLRRLHAFCAVAQQAAGAAPPPASGDGSGGASSRRSAVAEQRQLLAQPTVAAFAAAVAEQLRGLQQQVLVLETALSSSALLSLLQLAQRTSSLAQQAALLEGLVKRWCRRRGSPAETAAALLSGLHDELRVALLESQSQGGVLASMLLRVFLAATRPVLASLHAWLQRGALADLWGEFFIVAADASIPTDSPRFWECAYKLRSPSAVSGSGDSSASDPLSPVPCFLRPLAADILAAGKSALLLAAYSGWRRAASSGSGAAADAALAPATPSAALASQQVQSAVRHSELELNSPSKGRLAELGALGYVIASGQGKDAADQPALPSVAASAMLAPGSQAALAEEMLGLAQRRDPPSLWHRMMRSVDAQLQAHASMAAAEAAGAPAEQHGHQQQKGTPPNFDAASTERRRAGSMSSGSSSSSSCLLAWQPPATVACGRHSPGIPGQDTLPPLLSLPTSPEALPAAQAAVIQPKILQNKRGSKNPADSIHSCSAHSGRAGEEPSMADRMRDSAAARALQATCAAAKQLPLLLVPPMPLQVATGRPAEDGMHVSKQELADARTTLPAAATHQAQEKVQFDSGNWQHYYDKVSAALSCQLDVLDGINEQHSSGGSSGRRSRPKLPGSHGLSLSLPEYNGTVCDQLWHRGGSHAGAASGWLSPVAGPQLIAQSLQPEQAAAAPPLDVLLHTSLLQPVVARSQAAGSALCSALLRQGLPKQLAFLRETYLLGSPLLLPFVSSLFRRISTANGGMDRLSGFELDASLQDALAAAGSRASCLRATVRILPAEAVAAGGRRAGTAAPAAGSASHSRAAHGPLVQQLARLKLRLQPSWPLSLVVGEAMLEQYGAVLVLLLQLRWAKQSLQAVRYSDWKSGGRRAPKPAACDGLQHQMMHLVDAVLQYMHGRVAAAGAWLEAALPGCPSLDQMHACCSKYMRAMARYCLLSPDGVAGLVRQGLLHLLDACLQYCALRAKMASAQAALAALLELLSAGDMGGVAAALPSARGDGSGVADAAVSWSDGHPAAGDRPSSATTGGEPGQQGAAAAAAAAPPLGWTGRRAALQQQLADAAAQLAQLRTEFANRQRLMVRVLLAKAGEAGSHADELRQLLVALDYNSFYERGMMMA